MKEALPAPVGPRTARWTGHRCNKVLDLGGGSSSLEKKFKLEVFQEYPLKERYIQLQKNCFSGVFAAAVQCIRIVTLVSGSM